MFSTSKRFFAFVVVICGFWSLTPNEARAEIALDPHNPADVETSVRNFFVDVPIMVEIARCESGFRQFDSAGDALDGGAGGMIGVFQIHKLSHEAMSAALGFDIRTLEGNLAYARHLYEAEGTDPWISAYPCWKKAILSQTLAAPQQAAIVNTALDTRGAGVLETDLAFGMEHPEVLVLQRLLNSAGFTLAASGPGAPGEETTKFGTLTRAAVQRFQCAKSIACSGDEYRTSYGLVDAKTRAALLVAGNAKGVADTALTPASTAAESADIKALEAKIAELTKLVASLQLQLAVLASG